MALAISLFSRRPHSTVSPVISNPIRPTARLNLLFGMKTHYKERNRTFQVTGPTIVHWHGLHLPQGMAGHPMYAIQPRETYRYDFQVLDWARTYGLFLNHCHNLEHEDLGMMRNYRIDA